MVKKFTIRDFLNKLIWDKREVPDDYEICYLSRGAPGDIEKVSASKILKVYSRGFEYKDDRGIIKYIPFHRIIFIKNIKNNCYIFRSPRYFSNERSGA
ncbi:MAG: DUF504 domain-containing protein [Thermoproteales archaeon]|nr:DUF504 domain-containing protein [Thermoproteales archaeon]